MTKTCACPRHTFHLESMEIHVFCCKTLVAVSKKPQKFSNPISQPQNRQVYLSTNSLPVKPRWRQTIKLNRLTHRLTRVSKIAGDNKQLLKFHPATDKEEIFISLPRPRPDDGGLVPSFPRHMNHLATILPYSDGRDEFSIDLFRLFCLMPCELCKHKFSPDSTYTPRARPTNDDAATGNRKAVKKAKQKPKLRLREKYESELMLVSLFFMLLWLCPFLDDNKL